MTPRRKLVRPLRFTLARNDVACLIWALESVIEDYKYEDILRAYDSKGRYAA